MVAAQEAVEAAEAVPAVQAVREEAVPVQKHQRHRLEAVTIDLIMIDAVSFTSVIQIAEHLARKADGTPVLYLR